MNVNTEAKGTLAKLLATENITVEHRKVSTACFDVDKRLLILPIWKTASSAVYDLLVGHEVGHALYTPAEDFGNTPKDFVNVLEDVRIEKMIKVTYPGLRKSFYEGYNELWDQDFFGVKGEDINNISFIDRINLYYKGKRTIEFSLEEEIYVRRAEQTKTFKDVVELAKELYEYCEKKQEEKQKEEEQFKEPEMIDDPSSTGDEQEEIDIDNSGDSSDDDYDDMTDQELLDELFASPNSHIGGKEYYDQEPRETDERECITAEAFDEALETLIDENSREWVYLDLPKVDVDKAVTTYDQVQEDLYYHFEGYPTHDKHYHDYYQDNLDYAKNHYLKYKKEAQKTVNYLVKQFEMKKSADEYKRTATSKTGVINTNALFKYKLTDDIFKRIATVKEGKNHGLIMFLDWSGSMSPQLLDTLKQTYNLVWFCKKAGIPFRVYAFQSGYSSSQYDDHPAIDPKHNTLAIGNDFFLFEFLSSRQNAKSLERSLMYLYLQAFSINGHRLSSCQKYGLGGTPLAEAVLCSRELVRKMKRVENVSKVNVISLTDGEANPMSYLVDTERSDVEPYTWNNDRFRSSYIHNSSKVFFLRDPETGYCKKVTGNPYQTTAEIVGFHREITDYNWVGIRICSKSEMNRVARYFSFDDYDKIDKQWRKERFASIKKGIGFTEAFFIPDKGLGDGTNDIEVKQKGEVATKAELNRAFKKHMGSKTSNKTILNAFIEQIA